MDLDMLEARIKELNDKETKHYIDKFKDKTFVIKYGGAALVNKDKMPGFLRDIAAIYRSGIRLVIVHGGGKLLSQYMRESNIEVEFVNGMRLTRKEALPVAARAFGELNSDICSFLGGIGVETRALRGHLANLLSAEPIAQAKNESGEIENYVGQITAVNSRYLGKLETGIPVVTSLAPDQEDRETFYNINADLVATAIASAIGAEKLIFISDVNGIYTDKDDPSTHISHIDRAGIDKLIADGSLEGGMKLKVEMALDALEKGVGKIHFLNGGLDHSIIQEIFTHKGIGTEIVL